MCRLAAYLGTEISLENIIAKPRHSLLVQSLDAQEAKLRVNGDGFGIAWYGHMPEPGLFKDVLPAWADTNLRSICRLVRSSLFLAHVRAATTGTTSRDNCHPFTYGSWSFMHNGGIGDFPLIRRDLELLIPDPYFGARRGTTDSELFFHLLLTNGLEDDPLQALRKSITQVLELVDMHRATEKPVRLTCVFSEGTRIFAFRYSNDGQAPSLYRSDSLDHGGRAVASEPLEGQCARWKPLSANILLEISSDGSTERQLFPETASADAVHGAAAMPVRDRTAAGPA